ncbi:type II toxin-antitoxin system VapC family toxin [Methylomagnum sp.]
MKLFFDACAVVYTVESAEPYFADLARLCAKHRLEYPKAGIVVSRLSCLECLVKPIRDRNAALIGKYRDFFQSADLEIVELTADLVEIATHLRAQYGLATPDAIQAASSLISGAHVFVTNDAVFRRIPQLDVRIP